jgi:hypothetical protein
MAEEVEEHAPPISALLIVINGPNGPEIRASDDYIMLWGLSELIRIHANELHFRATSAIAAKKPKILVP